MSIARGAQIAAAWWRMGRPRRGAVTEYARFSYAFEAGAEARERFAGAFGDPSQLAAADLGAGPSETHVARRIYEIPWRRLVSVEAFAPYAEKLRAAETAAAAHEVHAGRIEDYLDRLAPGELDVALLIDVVEHFTRGHALALLKRVEEKFRLGAAIFIPLGRVDQEPYDQNELQRHRSTWHAADLTRLGYDVALYRGLHGQLEPAADAGWAIKRWG